jgi:hypothetical protein
MDKDTKNDDLKKKIIKYLLISFIVSLAARYLPNVVLSNEDVLKIGACAGITFAILDMLSPSIVVT